MRSSELTTLGGFAFSVNGLSMRGPATRKARALMAFLIMNRGADSARERLLEIFWPDADPERARDSLSTALHSIRSCLRTAGVQADTFLVATKSVVRWTADTTVDALQFATCAARESPAASQEALQLYRGDFLEGDYDDWAVSERERLAALYETVLARAMRTSRDVEAARRFIVRNPYNEEAYALLIEVELEASRAAAAAAWLDRCRIALGEVGEKPSASFEARFGSIARGELTAASQLSGRAQARKAGVRQQPVPTASPGAQPSNLPHQPTSFIGRAGEMADVKALLAKSQVVTLVGTGGVGKTRVALQVGADLLKDFRDGVHFVDLAQVAGEDYVVSQIASICGVHALGERSLLDQVLLHLRENRSLLILDNCEHVIVEASRIIVAIIKNCAHVKVLATSRELLNVRGEQVYQLPSLSTPPEKGELSALDALDHEAVALFVDRASAADARFTFTDDKARIVADICRRLDGIALAIELAAARVRILNVSQLEQRIDERFHLLTGGDRTALPRQRTMRATIDWSYGLLSEEAKTLYRRLSIFQGGWTLEAAIAVCADDLLDAHAVLEKLSSLVDKSLVVVDLENESQRYRLLETLRQYGVERLKQRGEFDAVAERHAVYFAEFGRRAAAAGRATPKPAWLAHVDGELDNIRAVLEWSLSQRNDPILGGHLAENLWVFWLTRHPQEGRRWVELALSAVSAQAEPRLHVALALSVPRLCIQWFSETGAAVERALVAARSLGDERMLARAAYYYGDTLIFLNRLDEAEVALNEALMIAQRVGDGYRAAMVLEDLSRLQRKRGKFSLARGLLSQAEELCPNALAERPLALINQACLEKHEGNLTRAIELLQEAQRIAQTLGDSRLEAIVETCLVSYLANSHDAFEARNIARHALRMTCDTGWDDYVPFIAQAMAEVELRHGDPRRAAQFFGYADGAFAKQFYKRDAFWEVDFDSLVRTLTDRLGNDQPVEPMAEGAAWSSDRAVEELRSVLA